VDSPAGRKNRGLAPKMRCGVGFFAVRQFPPRVLTMKKSILIVGHQLEISWKNQVIASGYKFEI
jgi:hypothetical protein